MLLNLGAESVGQGRDGLERTLMTTDYVAVDSNRNCILGDHLEGLIVVKRSGVRSGWRGLP